MKNTRELPYEVFHLCSMLLPHLSRVFDACNLTPKELFVLIYIKHFNKKFEDKGTVILASEVRDILKRVFHESASQASKDVLGLVDRNLLSVTRLTNKEMKQLYGDTRGRRDALILLEAGSKKIDEFTTIINDLFARLTATMPQPAFVLFSEAIKKFAETTVKRLYPQ